MTGKEYVEYMDAIADAIGTKDFSIRYMENAYREPLKQIPGTDIFVSALMLMNLERDKRTLTKFIIII